MHLPHARRQEPLSMRQPKFKSWPAWHKRLQLAIHLEYARAPFFFLSGDQAAQELAGREQTPSKVVKERACPATDELANLLGQRPKNPQASTGGQQRRTTPN